MAFAAVERQRSMRQLRVSAGYTTRRRGLVTDIPCPPLTKRCTILFRRGPRIRGLRGLRGLRVGHAVTMGTADCRKISDGPRREPFNSTHMGANPIPSGSPHVRCTPIGRTCGEPDEIKKNTTRKTLLLLLWLGDPDDDIKQLVEDLTARVKQGEVG